MRLKHRYGERLTIRVSIDHYGRQVHELERGKRSWAPTIDGLVWLARNGVSLHVAQPPPVEGSSAVPLNHPHCAKFCVLGGGACSRG